MQSSATGTGAMRAIVQSTDLPGFKNLEGRPATIETPATPAYIAMGIT
ncbi:MAG TPA: hypothetical protein VIF10_14365 [Methylobacter sp.]|jgi:hypothetical protein